MDSSTETYYDWYIPDGKGGALAYKEPNKDPVFLNLVAASKAVESELLKTNQQRTKLFAIKRAIERTK